MLGHGQHVTVIGCGYVGLVTAVGLAEQGLQVRAFDVDRGRVAACRALDFPIMEPGLAEAARGAGDRLTFHDVREEPWSSRSMFTFVAVPTPQGEAGHPNLSMLGEALEWIACSGPGPGSDNLIVIRSTVPPGTARWAQREIARLVGREVPVVANPEFLQEGRALQDFRAPSRVVIGGDDPGAAGRLRDLLSFTSAPVVLMSTSAAELAKYGSNAFLAIRVSFANELAALAEREGADALEVLGAIGMDPRIGSRYLTPGIGYGGSCLPKDVAALISMGNAHGQPMDLLVATRAVNHEQRQRVLRALASRLGTLTDRRISVLGLAFKPGTNDVRESPGLLLADELVRTGADVIAWDPVVQDAELPSVRRPIVAEADLMRAITGSDAIVLATEWEEAVLLDLTRAARVMRGRLLIDGRYAWQPATAAAAGLDLVRIGMEGRSLDAAVA